MYKSKQGDILFVNLNPTKGYEQSGFRPVVVVSNDVYNSFSSIRIIAPITNTNREFPLNVKLSDSLETTGTVICQHLRAIDTEQREAIFKEELPAETLEKILAIVPNLF
ncbi:type II toxin-antitoxin system PemK/MazF family toxin [Carnobacterium maltaromaticum]|uniref:type II toxin-antitoxin system PemK/MazF family toxin n=1 Tax=Carnobacterium maltaromaticum TaxID=2751 RepID=UPI00295E3545|nr:type II toxin-antitoxin system PemK/MazF family toxin [Carnobacterium maltaromaticum]